MTATVELHPNSKRTPERVAAIRNAMSLGLDYSNAAFVAGITPETLRVWRRDDPELSADLARLKASVVLRGSAKLMQIIEAIDPKDPNPVAVRALLAFLKAHAVEFRDVVDPGGTDQGGDDRAPVLVTIEPAKSVESWQEANRPALPGEGT